MCLVYRNFAEYIGRQDEAHVAYVGTEALLCVPISVFYLTFDDISGIVRNIVWEVEEDVV